MIFTAWVSSLTVTFYHMLSTWVHSLYIATYCITAPVLKICRTSGHTACSKTKMAMVHLDKLHVTWAVPEVSLYLEMLPFTFAHSYTTCIFMVTALFQFCTLTKWQVFYLHGLKWILLCSIVSTLDHKVLWHVINITFWPLCFVVWVNSTVR